MIIPLYQTVELKVLDRRPSDLEKSQDDDDADDADDSGENDGAIQDHRGFD